MNPRDIQDDLKPGHIYPAVEAPGLTGGQGALLNLERLRFNRDLGAVKVPLTNTLIDLQWAPAQDFAIERDNQQQVWHSGHASALLSDGAVAIVASRTGGVWVVNPRPDAIPITNSHEALPLSDDWDNPDVTCLAFAPGTTSQFFAGCAAGALYFVELQPVLGGMEPKRTTSLPLPFFAGDIQQILVVESLRRIVLATATGVWWSPIPSAPSDASAYAWRDAVDLPGGTYSGLAEGPSETVVAAALGDGTSGHSGIFVGRWQRIELVFVPVDKRMIVGVDPTRMLRTSLASCDADRRFVYAVAAGADKLILAALASTDGGLSWNAVATPQDGGNQGDYNNCLAVSPFHPKVVVLGWRSSGLFFSTDGGTSWSRPHTDVDNLNLHSDLHALYFTRNQPGEDHLFAGSDGGVIATQDLGQSWDSRYNKHLRTLQIGTVVTPQPQGQMTASSRFPGLIVCATQDNGNIYSDLSSNRPSWKRLDGGDGGPNRFIDALGAVVRYNNTLKLPGTEIEYGNHVRIAFWHPTTGAFDGDDKKVVPVEGEVPLGGEFGGLPFPFLETVRSPSWTRNGKLMYAVAAKTRARPANATLETPNVGKIYGLFANPDGTDVTFALLADIGEVIAGLASRDGRTVLVGTETGRIISFDSETRAVTELRVPAAYAGSGKFGRLDDLEPHRAFALHASGSLVRYDGSSWTQTAGAGFVSFEADPRPGSRRLFGATDTSVLMTTDDGATWFDVSKGLPARPHCNDLRMAADGRGGHDLYLGTYGRSVWKARIDHPDPVPVPPHIPGAVVDIIFGVIGDGGGLISIGGQIIRVPPREPVRDILGGLVIEEIARSLSEGAGREIRLAAMRTVREVVEAQIRQLSAGY